MIEHEAEQNKIPLVSADNTVGELRKWLTGDGATYNYKTLLIVDESKGVITGAISREAIFKNDIADQEKINVVIPQKAHPVYLDNSLKVAVHFMLKTEQDVLPVIDRNTKHIIGAISQADIFKAYDEQLNSDGHRQTYISTKRNVLKVILKGKQLLKATE